MTRDTEGDWAPRETSRSSARHGRAPEDYDPGAPAGPYAPQPDSYGAPGGYAQPDSGYAQPDAYAAPGGYAQPDGYAQAPYPQPDAYGQPDGYGQPDAYAQADLYAAPSAYGAPGGYAEPGPYGAPDDNPLTAPGRYGGAPAGPSTEPGQASSPGRRRRPDGYPGAEASPGREAQPGRRRRPDGYPEQDPDAQTDPSYRPGPPDQGGYRTRGGYTAVGRREEPSALDTPAPYPTRNGRDGPVSYAPGPGYAPPDPYARPEPGAGRGGGAGPDFGQAAYRQEDPYGRPGASGEFAGPGPAGYATPDRAGYGRPGTRDELAGPQPGGYGGRPGAADELTGPQPGGYRPAGPADQVTGPQRNGYGGPGSYRRPDDSNPYGTPAAPPADGQGAFRWQPGADDAASPQGLAALPPQPGRTPPQPPQPPPGRTGPQRPPRGPDWDSQPPQWGQGPDTGGFAARGPAPAAAPPGARRADDSGIGLQPPAAQVGKGSWPEDAPEQDDDDWDDEPSRIGGLIPGFGGGRDSGGRPRRRAGRRIAPILAPILALVVFAALGVGGFRLYQHFQSKDFTGPGTGEVTVQVLAGDTATSLAPRLVKAGVVASASSFISAAKVSTNPSGLEPGFFAMHKQMNSALAYKLLLSPKARVQTVVAVPEGLRETQILTLLEKKTPTIPASQFTAASKDLAALGLPSYAAGRAEGYLFPATYDFNPGTSPAAMLKAMVARYDQEAASINLPAAAKAANVTPNQVITVASILEAEAGQQRYLAQVAEVIYNRLNRGMPLQVDSTENYALNRTGISLTQSQLHVNSPYNTFLHKGLPPTPIDSPGDAAIQAALHPDHGDLLYFVTVNLKTGLTRFTDNPTTFAQFVAECQANKAC